MHLVVINGRPGVGKTTFCSMCAQLMGSERCINISTVDNVKDVAMYCGWDGTKTPEARKFLSELKRIMKEFDDLPFKHTCEFIDTAREDYSRWHKGDSDFVVFVDCREPEEIERLVNKYGGRALLIRRPWVEVDETSNESDRDVFRYPYDKTIWNVGDEEHLKKEAASFVDDLLTNKF